MWEIRTFRSVIVTRSGIQGWCISFISGPIEMVIVCLLCPAAIVGFEIAIDCCWKRSERIQWTWRRHVDFYVFVAK